jgi:hypothetical protein
MTVILIILLIMVIELWALLIEDGVGTELLIQKAID